MYANQTSLRSGGCIHVCISCAACSAHLSSHKATLEACTKTPSPLPDIQTCDLILDIMAAAPFGFSVGDFIAGIQLIHKATKALRAASGATAQFQQAILDLELIATVLRRVQGLTPATASDETIRTVQYCGAVCHAPLGSFLQRIKRLEPCLDFEHKSDKSRLDKAISGGRKLQWALSLEKRLRS